jgi:hypothetical protein
MHAKWVAAVAAGAVAGAYGLGTSGLPGPLIAAGLLERLIGG